MAAVLDRHLRGRTFVVGDWVSVGDFIVAYTLDWADQTALLAPYPRLQDYMLAMYARPRAPMRIADAFASLQAA